MIVKHYIRQFYMVTDNIA